MYDVLMLHDRKWTDCHVCDYLKISGYRVTELDIYEMEGLDHRILHKDIIMIVCEYAEMCVDICGQMREYTQLPIMVVTKTDDEWVKVKMFQTGADDYITEPYQQIVLIARIQARIEQYRRLTRLFGYVKVRGLVIEEIGRRVFLDDKEILLTIKEFDILLYMARHANSVVTREELYNAVWKEPMADSVHGTISTHIKRLRRKIEEDPENPQYIETVWGAGYRFVM